MKLRMVGLAAGVVSWSLLAGCGPNSAETETTSAAESTSAPAGGAKTEDTPAAGTPVVSGAPLGSVKVGDQAVCVVCATQEGKAEPEEVKATLDYKGKTYAFCSEEEKAEFISDPAKYVRTSP